MAGFEGRVVVVTGGAGGLGVGICHSFLSAGASVVCVDTNAAAGRDLVEREADARGELVFHEADVSVSRACGELVESTIERFGRIDVLCNNVGIQPCESGVPAHELPEELWDRILDVNLKSSYLMSKHCIPQMQRQKSGVIINTASVQGLQSMKGCAAYAASKGGLIMLTRQLALEDARDNTRVLAVNPGTIETPLVDEVAASSPLPIDEQRAIWEDAHPIGRFGKTEEVGDVVRFLASDEASFMTGEYVNVDGGLMAKGAWA